MWPFTKSLQTIHCDVHNLNIVVYPEADQSKFIDDDIEEVAIFITNGKKELKRYVVGKCDLSCATVKSVLE